MTHFKLINVALTYRCNKNCSYCYTNGLGDEYEDMTVEDYLELLGWFKKQKIKEFNFIGGEPTIHPRIKAFLRIGVQKGFIIGVLTNGLFDSDILSLLDKKSHFLINYNPQEHYTRDEYKLLHRNLELIKEKGIRFTLGFLITGATVSAEHIISAVRRFNPDDVKLDMIVPNSLGCNVFLSREGYKVKRDMMQKFQKQIEAEGIKVRAYLSMPYCEYKKTETNFCPICGAGCDLFVVNPDLTIFPCVLLFLKGPKITSIKNNPKSFIQNFYKEPLSELKWKRYLYKECENCIWRVRKKCQGGCLAYKCVPFNIFRYGGFTIFSQYSKSEIVDFVRKLEGVVFRLREKFGAGVRPKVYLFKDRGEMSYYSGVYPNPKGRDGFVKHRIYYHYGTKVNEEKLTYELTRIFTQKLKKK